jgi:hypothetical protein
MLARSTTALQARLKPLIRGTQPYAKKIAHRDIWVEPQLLAEIEYRAKSAEGKVLQGHPGGLVMTDGPKKMVWIYVLYQPPCPPSRLSQGVCNPGRCR